MNERLVIAAPEPTAEKLNGILLTAGIEAGRIANVGAQALEAITAGSVLLTTWRLADMSGVELAAKAPLCTALMIVPQDYAENAGENVLTLRNPVSQDALVQAVRTLLFCQGRIAQLEQKAEKLATRLEERKIIEKAKGRLMEEKHIPEAEAHYFMQKLSMDGGRRIIDVAKEIIEAETLE